MKPRSWMSCVSVRAIGALTAIGVTTTIRAADTAAIDALSETKVVAPLPAEDLRAGGVLQESFSYHRQGATAAAAGPHAQLRSIAQPHGWYGYGFPVETYRWGWFGAGRYSPRVVWHRGYYGECCRWGYRQGY